MNPRQIDAFRAVMDTGSVSRAAERLFISQPAVSKLIQNLEQSVGLVLFDRTRGRMSPTPEARMLLEEIERLFRGLNSLKTFAEEIRTLHHGSLRIGIMPALSVGFIQDRIADFVADHPLTQITLHARSSVKLVEWLVSGHLDIAISSHPIDHPDVIQIPVCRRRYVCIAPLKHPIGRHRTVRPQHLSGESFISFPPGAHMRATIDGIFEEANVARKLTLEASMSPSICALVARGLGVAILNPLYLGQFTGVLTVRPFQPVIEDEIRIMVPRHQRRSLTTQAFVERTKAWAAAWPDI